MSPYSLSELEAAPDQLRKGPAGAVTTREEMRSAIVDGIDSTTTGFFSRFIGHDTRKVLNAQRAFYMQRTEQVGVVLDELLQLYSQGP